MCRMAGRAALEGGRVFIWSCGIKGEQSLEKMPVGTLMLRVLRAPMTAGDRGATKQIVNPGQIP